LDGIGFEVGSVTGIVSDSNVAVPISFADTNVTSGVFSGLQTFNGGNSATLRYDEHSPDGIDAFANVEIQMSKTRWLTKWMLSIVFVAAHTIALVWYADKEGPISGPDADSGAIAWIPWLFIDFPVIWLALPFSDLVRSTNVGALFAIGVLGGFQWAFLGYGLQRVLGYMFQSHRK
jgi:hypothetical protein